MDHHLVDRVTVTRGWPQQYDLRNPRVPPELERLKRLAQHLLANDPDLTDAERDHLQRVWVAYQPGMVWSAKLSRWRKPA